MLQTEELQTAREKRDAEIIGEYRELVKTTVAGAEIDIESIDWLLRELNIRDADLLADVEAMRDHAQLVEDCRQFEAAEPGLSRKIAKLKKERLAARDAVLHATRRETEAFLRERTVGKAWNRERARQDRLDAILRNRRLFDPPSDAA